MHRRLGLSLALLALAVPDCVSAASLPTWVSLEVIENTAEGPAATRCAVDRVAPAGAEVRWRVLYGEVQPRAGGSWTAVRSRAACAEIASAAAADAWVLRGAPYLRLEVVLRPTAGADGELGFDAEITTRKLTGFAAGGVPEYRDTSERRRLQIADGGSTVVPALVASADENRELRLRELLLRFRAARLGSRAGAEYGGVAVSADVPRASILVDGGFVGWTSSEGPTAVEPVRTGSHDVAVRDASGRQAGASVRVRKGEVSKVELRLLPSAAGAGSDGLLPLGPNPEGSDELWRQKDGAIMVRIPAGEVGMGSPDAEGEPAEHPRHLVRTGAFLIDKTEVSWGQYRRFAAASGRALPKAPAWGMPDGLAATNVLWDDAAAYCAWAGGRLPSEAEWERAARGSHSWRYPWGDDWDAARCNSRDGGPHAPTVVGSFPACVSPFGVLDLPGGVAEWCADWFDPTYYARSPAENPKGPEKGELRASRGGSWIDAAQTSRSAHRQGTDPKWPDPRRGFRCARDDRGAATAPKPAASPAPSGAAAAPAETQLSTLALHVETRVNRAGKAPARCEVVQPTRPSTSWSSVGAARAAAGGIELADTASHCGPGPSSGAAGREPRDAPFLILDLGLTAVMDPAPMDPGPAGAFQLVLALTWQRLDGFDAGGKPRYREPATSHRMARLSAGEEVVVPVLTPDVGERQALGLEDVLVRVTAEQAQGTPFGGLALIDAAPGSEVVVDGGVVGRAAADGTLTVRALPAGVHEVGLRTREGKSASRMVTVARGRTAVASAAGVAAAGFAPAGKNAAGFAEVERRRDGALMVEIPAAAITMGNLDAEGKPLPHPVRVSGFLFDKLPLTWGRFKRYAAASGQLLPPAPYWGIHDDHPVVFVRWDEARAYCEWAGGRLPTEAERELAARGTDGRKFPWGAEEPTPERAVFRREWGYDGTDPVGIRPEGASPYGILDAGGNVWEWCEDWYDPDYYASSPVENPPGPKTGRAHVVRGGSWDSRPTVLSSSCRNFGYVGYREGDFGFRCAADLAPAPRP